jgi:hypothetical protein
MLLVLFFFLIVAECGGCDWLKRIKLDFPSLLGLSMTSFDSGFEDFGMRL